MTIKALADYLKDKDNIAIIGHISPDGDAVGSAIAIALAFEKLGKKAVAVLPGAVPKKYMFLKGADKVVLPDNLPFEIKCALASDVSDTYRMGEAEKVFNDAENKALIDHHETNRGFGDVYHVDGDAASTGELVLELLETMGADIDKDIASALFIAISTDTGNFNYSSTNQKTYAAASKCLDYGAEVEPLTKHAFRMRSLSATLLLGEALSRVKTCLDGKIAYTYVDNAMLDKCGATLEDATRIANYLNEVEGALVGVYFEQRPGNTKISWRSGMEIDVSGIARSFAGGGHSSAAGANLTISMDEAIEKVIAATIEAVKAQL